MAPALTRKRATPTLWALLAMSLLLYAGAAPAQTADIDKEPAAILELGGAASRSVKGESSFGPTVAVEFTPIKNWLEIETGVTPLFTRHSSEWDTDFLFKKPWTLSKKVELMVGVGPEWVYTRQSGVGRSAFAMEGVLDFMFWPSPKRKFGWYLEPSYDHTFGRSHENSLGITGGLLIAFP
jgi:hypothetical protein